MITVDVCCMQHACISLAFIGQKLLSEVAKPGHFQNFHPPLVDPQLSPQHVTLQFFNSVKKKFCNRHMHGEMHRALPRNRKTTFCPKDPSKKHSKHEVQGGLKLMKQACSSTIKPIINSYPSNTLIVLTVHHIILSRGFKAFLTPMSLTPCHPVNPTAQPPTQPWTTDLRIEFSPRTDTERHVATSAAQRQLRQGPADLGDRGTDHSDHEDGHGDVQAWRRDVGGAVRQRRSRFDQGDTGSNSPRGCASKCDGCRMTRAVLFFGEDDAH